MLSASLKNGSAPLSDPHVRCTGTITAVPGAPKTTDLITDGENGSGGTFHVHTSRQPFGATMEPPSFDSGIPVLRDPVGRIKITPSSGRTHHVTLDSLVPGNPFHFTIMVVDPGGNWDVLTSSFATLGRRVTVQFPQMRILNDGDPSSVGGGEF